MISFGNSLGGGRRSAAREAAPLIVHMTSLSRTYQAVLVDISATGARVEGTALPPLGQELNLTMSDFKTFATVRWEAKGQVGLQFFEPLLQEQVISIRREVVQSGGLEPAIKAAMEDWVLGLAR